MNIKWCKSSYRAVKVPLADSRVCPREHQVVVLHAISPISMKFCLPQRSNRQNGFFFPCFFLVHQGNRLKIHHSMNISLRWYLTDYSKRLHTYCYILDLWMHDASNSQFDWQFVKANTWLFFFLTLKSANMAFVRHKILISPSFDCLLSFSHNSQLRNCNQRGDFKVTRRVLISTTGVRSSLVCYNFVQWNSWSYWGVLIAWDKCGLICCLCLSHSSPVYKPHVLILFVFSHSAERNVMIEIL